MNSLSNQTVSNNLIRSFVVIIVALGISSVLVVSVVQKQREIGILRAMGAGWRRIMTVFLLQGGLVGSVLGSALAFGLLVVFSFVFKSPDGGSLFSAQLDPPHSLRPVSERQQLVLTKGRFLEVKFQRHPPNGNVCVTINEGIKSPGIHS